MKRRAQRYSEQLIQRVNELYYDFIGERCDYPHPETFDQEKARWQRIAKNLCRLPGPKTIIDIGTGTGFVPLTLAPLLRAGDIFICSDISQRILAVAQQSIRKQNFSCRFRFMKITNAVPFRLSLKSESVDMVTMNSVLHHIPDTDTFIRECDRVLKVNGSLLIGHEPNKRFFEHRVLHATYLISDFIFTPRQLIKAIVRKMHALALLRYIYYSLHAEKKRQFIIGSELFRRINKTLHEDGLITAPLAFDEIDEIKDIKSEEGFEPDLLLPHYELVQVEFYNYLFGVSMKHYHNRLVRKYDTWLSKKYPGRGATFFVVLKKSRP